MGSLHRVGAAVVGGFVFVFGLAGLAARPEVYSTEGPVVFGMTTNGLLAFASLAVGIVLLFATVLGGQVVAWAAITAGAAFFLSGVVNVFLLGTSLNVMAFTMPNVVFSWVVGAVLVALGVIGRQQHQTSDNLSGSHVEREGAAPQVHTNPVAAAELAEAERAFALHHATEEQIERLHEADKYRTAADRRHAWEESDRRHESPSG
jgi:lysylphosphatidylglycerol synthetase-like protein (DUF2156 family)